MKKQLVPLLALFSLLLTANMVFAQWPMDGHDAGRTGYYPGVFPSEKTISWQTGFEGSVTEIVIGANNVFTRFRNWTADAVSALDPSNGQAKWTVQVPKGIFNNMAYSSSGLLVSHPDGVICIDVNNGDFLWEINDSCDEGIILQANKLLLIDSFAVEMYNLDSRQKQWGESYFTDRFRSDFVVSENAIFMSFSGALYAFDASNGEQIYKKSMKGGSSSPVYSNGKIYVGTTDGQMYCIESSSGTLEWAFQTDGNKTGEPFSEALAPAVGGGNVVFGAFDDKLYCLDEAGNLKWKTAGVSLSYDSQPAITDNLAFLISSTNKLRCFDIETGEEIWTLKSGSTELEASPKDTPILYNGRVFGITGTGGVNSNAYAFSVVPEFPPSAALLLLCLVTLVSVVIYRRKRR